MWIKCENTFKYVQKYSNTYGTESTGVALVALLIFICSVGACLGNTRYLPVFKQFLRNRAHPKEYF